MMLARLSVFAAALLLAATAAHAQVAFRSAATAVQAASTYATITHIGAGAAANDDTTTCNNTVSPAMPGGLANDVLIALVSSREDGAAVAASAGWTLAHSVTYAPAGAELQAYVYYKVATGTNTAADPLTITQSTACNTLTARVSRFRGVDVSQPLVTSPIPAGNRVMQNSGDLDTGTETTTLNGSMLIVAGFLGDDRTVTAGAGWSESFDTAHNLNRDHGLSLHYMLQATAGAASVANWDLSGGGNDPNIGIIFALRPALQGGFTINVPAGTVAQDVMLASIVVRPSSVIITPPAGWSAQAATVQNSGDSTRQQVFYRVSPGGEPANYTWTVDTAHAGAAGAIVTYSGVDNTSPIDAFAGNTTPSGTGHTATSVTTTVADAMVVSTHAFGSAATWTSAGVTERVDIASQAASTNGVSLSLYDATQAVAGATGNRTATASGNADFGSAHFIALRPFVPQPVLTWSLNQLSWNGTAGEVIDLSGNGLHGTSSGGASTSNTTPAIAGNPGSCQYGVFDGNNDFVQVADNALLDVTDELTVMMWLRPTAYPTAGNLKSFVSKDQNYEAHLTSTGTINWWWGGGALELNSAGTVPLNQWTHVALVYSRAGAFQRIYRNGVQDANTNNQAGALVPNNMPFQIAADQGFAGRNFAGWIDEVHVFRNALSAARIAQYMNTTRPCVGVVDHFAISHAGNGVGCMDHQITITAHNSAHAAVDANALAVNLSTSHGKGTWTGIFAGGGTLNDVTAGDGAATYTFGVGSNAVTLLFRNANIAGTSETFNFNVSGGGYSEATGTASGSDDPPFTMYGAGFRMRNITDAVDAVPTQISGKPSDTGWNAKTLRIQAINTDSVSGSCTNLFASQAQNVELGAECNSPAACSAGPLPVSINGGNIATSNDNAGAGAAAYTSVALNFNANSEADTVIAYPNAGSVSLHARYDLNGAVAGFEMQGSSNAFVVRPFGLAFSGIAHGNTAGGGVVAAAGDPFSMTLTAYRWANGEDANNDGVPDAGVNITDNGATPNFAATAMVAVQAGGNLPGVADGAITRGVGCASVPSVALAGGTASAADWCYSEVGNVLLTAAVNDYLGATDADIAGNSGLDGDANGGYVGRFKPKHFAVTGSPTLANRSGLACAPASPFTYMGERLTLGFTLEAQNAQNAITQNYTGAYAKLDLTTAANLGIGARSGATDLTPRVDSSLAPTGSFTDGVAALLAHTAIRRALSPDNPDGPYAATQFGIAPNDNDPAALTGVRMGTLNQDVDGAGGNDHFAVGPTAELRFGRMRLQNGYAPDNAGVQIGLDIQYWNNGGFTLNAADSCTTLARDNIALTFSGAVAACDTAVVQPSLAFTAGQSVLTLTAPGAGNTGIVTLTPNLGTAAGTYCPAPGGATAAATSSPASYLLGRWDDAANPDGNANTAYDDKPFGRATFGLYGSQPKNFIFFRENY